VRVLLDGCMGKGAALRSAVGGSVLLWHIKAYTHTQIEVYHSYSQMLPQCFSIYSQFTVAKYDF